MVNLSLLVIVAGALCTTHGHILRSFKCDMCACHIVTTNTELAPSSGNTLILNCTSSGNMKSDGNPAVLIPEASSYERYNEDFTYTWAEFKQNKISRVQNLYLDVQNLNKLYLDDNNIEIVYDNAFRRMNRTLKELYLSHNKIQQLKLKMTESLSKLEILDLSHNLLTEFKFDEVNLKDSLKVLLLSSNQITSIDRGSKEVMILEKLDLSYNKITLLDGNTFPVMKKLRYIDLCHNEISKIDDFVFNNMIALQTIDLSMNNLSDVNVANKYVKTLKIGNNSVITLKNMIQTMPNIEELHLENNGMSKLDTLIDLSRIKVLNLSGNIFSEFPPKRFPNLTELDLSSNVLESVPIGLTAEYLPELRKLILDNNPIETLQFPHAVDDRDKLRFKDLRWLSIRYMPKMETVSGTAFKNLVIRGANPNREPSNEEVTDSPCVDGLSLIISHNPVLSKVQEGAFDSTRLCQLDLSHNVLRTMPSNLVEWNTLQYLDLQDNPWNCECPQQWMLEKIVEHLFKQRPELLYELRCDSPLRYRDKRMAHFYQWKGQAFCAQTAAYVESKDNSVSTNVDMASSEGMLIAIGVLGTLFLVLVITGLALHYRSVKAQRHRNRRF